MPNGVASYLVVLALTGTIGLLWRARRRVAPAVVAAPARSRAGVLAVLAVAAAFCAAAFSGRIHPTTTAAPKPAPAPTVTHTIVRTHTVIQQVASHPLLTGTEITVMWIAGVVAAVAVVSIVVSRVL